MHEINEPLDLPPVVLVERRRTPDRRHGPWRGGRRNSDWTTRRPIGAWSHLEKRESAWRQWVVSLAGRVQAASGL
jgi:hypothetical protein